MQNVKKMKWTFRKIEVKRFVQYTREFVTNVLKRKQKLKESIAFSRSMIIETIQDLKDIRDTYYLSGLFNGNVDADAIHGKGNKNDPVYQSYIKKEYSNIDQSILKLKNRLMLIKENEQAIIRVMLVFERTEDIMRMHYYVASQLWYLHCASYQTLAKEIGRGKATISLMLQQEADVVTHLCNSSCDNKDIISLPADQLMQIVRHKNEELYKDILNIEK